MIKKVFFFEKKKKKLEGFDQSRITSSIKNIDGYFSNSYDPINIFYILEGTEWVVFKIFDKKIRILSLYGCI